MIVVFMKNRWTKESAQHKTLPTTLAKLQERYWKLELTLTNILVNTHE